MTAIHTLNHSPIATIPKMTSHEAYLDTKSNVSHFCIFGCDTYVHVPRKDHGKMDPTS